MKSHNAPKRVDEMADPATFGHDRFKKLMHVIHDLGGEKGGPISLEERKSEPWELGTYAICECLTWRGVWTNVEKLRRGADLGDKYLAVPYSGRWLLAAMRALVDKQHITLTELTEKIEEVKKRHAQKSLL
ncbi:SH3-like domain-containing protein [Thioalkalivibrio thiocyanodenitrificans]|uniref:SH3-like domain-containing protein n=1 Tax=Thioalkalivibrio thiocyanodenitrificans TaxID=243063 RepID=UPI0003A31B79|nr:SH3-like domain-containing protein [Thioalkalivibrio thiocyanodenitrificans]